MAFKKKMAQRLTGKDAVSASQLARETGVRQPNLSRWLEGRSLPVVADKPSPSARERTVTFKARVLAEAAKLDGDAPTLNGLDGRGAHHAQSRTDDASR